MGVNDLLLPVRSSSTCQLIPFIISSPPYSPLDRSFIPLHVMNEPQVSGGSDGNDMKTEGIRDRTVFNWHGFLLYGHSISLRFQPMIHLRRDRSLIASHSRLFIHGLSFTLITSTSLPTVSYRMLASFRHTLTLSFPFVSRTE